MTQFKYNNKTYILADFILEKAPIYSKGCRSTRDLIKKKQINESDYLFARLDDNQWVITDGKSPKFDKVFIRKLFTKSIPELNSEENIQDDNGVEKAPDLIHLNDDEKFQDDQGNILDIETRGIREHDKIYFKVKDISTMFNITYLNDSLTDSNGKYEKNIDYKYFICTKEGNSRQKTTKIDETKTLVKKELFLTFEGMLRVLFVSRNNKTNKFINWATKTLFAAQMGTIEQKNKLVSKIKGVSYETIQELFSINARQMPCIYLTAFNTVDKLRHAMDISNNHSDGDIVYKFGLTKSFETRKYGHTQEYKKIDDLIDKKLIYFTYIDPIYITQAEVEIKEILEEYKLEWDNHKELVIIPNNMLKFVKTAYENIGMKYSGHTAEFNVKINELNAKIITLENQANNLTKEIDNLKELYEHKLALKDQIISNHISENNHLKEIYQIQIESLKKDNEILQLKLQLTQK